MDTLNVNRFFQPSNSGAPSSKKEEKQTATNSNIPVPTSGWSMLEAALAYARTGWAVLPLHSVSHGQCSCRKPDCATPGKHPRTQKGVKDATSDPEKIRQWWTKSPEANIGLATGSRSKRVVLDVDIKKGKRGDQSLETLVKEHGFLPRTLTNRTPSGGWHFIFRLPSGSMGTPINVRTGLDILGEGRYIVAPPSSIKGKRYECIVAEPEGECPEWLVELSNEGQRLSPSFTGDIADLIRELLPKGQERQGEWMTNCPFHDDQHPSFSVRLADGVFHCFACDAKGNVVKLYAHLKGVSEGEAQKTVKELLMRTYLDELNKVHAVVRIQGKVVILNEEVDPIHGWKDISLSSSADLKLLYSNRVFPGQRRNENVATLWLHHRERKEFKGIVFSPKKDIPGYYNLWQGFAVESKEGDCRLFLNHIRDNIAKGDDKIYQYILAWMADIVQRPAQRPGVALVLRGKQGTGKGVFCSEFATLFGPHFFHAQHKQHLVGNFNAHLKNALLVFADEAFWAGDKSHEGTLKTMITEDKLPIEFKGKDVIFVKNHIHLLVASNHDWVVPAGFEERRFFVLDVSEEHMQDQEYFEALVNHMKEGGREALLHYLLNLDLSQVNLRKFPKTDALLENKHLSMNPVQKFWFECLWNGTLKYEEKEWNWFVKRKDLHDFYVEHAKKVGQTRRSTETELGKGLRKLVPWVRTKKTIEEGNIWEFPPLQECREYFDQITGQNQPWPEEEPYYREPPQHLSLGDEPFE